MNGKQASVEPARRLITQEVERRVCDPSSVKSGSKPGISSCFTKVTKKMNALPGIVSSKPSLLASPDLTEEVLESARQNV